MRTIAPDWSAQADALSNTSSMDAHVLDSIGRNLRATYEAVTAAPLPEELSALAQRLVGGDSGSGEAG